MAISAREPCSLACSCTVFRGMPPCFFRWFSSGKTRLRLLLPRVEEHGGVKSMMACASSFEDGARTTVPAASIRREDGVVSEGG